MGEHSPVPAGGERHGANRGQEWDHLRRRVWVPAQTDVVSAALRETTLQPHEASARFGALGEAEDCKLPGGYVLCNHPTESMNCLLYGYNTF